MEKLRRQFDSRESLVDYVRTLTPWLDTYEVTPFEGGSQPAARALSKVKPARYSRTRNFLEGHVTRLSPYIRHGVLTLDSVRNLALSECESSSQAEKFIQELAWRDYWQRRYRHHPEQIWNDIEPYKTGYRPDDYDESLPRDIAHGTTGVACIDQFIAELLETGYLHNHARMYVASYVVHWRRIRWQAGAAWFLHHLIDGDPASNNFSWQWVASTFANKPYIFNLDNVRKYSGVTVDTSTKNNAVLDASYETLAQKLFPNLKAESNAR